MAEEKNWVLTFTPPGKAGEPVGRYKTRDDAMIAAEADYDRRTGQTDSDDLGWQMGFNGATALSPIGIFRLSKR
jgi:hypothetical protein